MKAVIFEEYGPPEVLHLKEVPTPIPQAKEVLIKIHATSVNSGDYRLRKADPFAARFFVGLIRPKIKILGCVLAGEIVQIGKDVSKFKVGDRVFGMSEKSFGTYAQFKCLPEDTPLAIMPDELTYEDAAAFPFGATTALYFLQKAKLTKGQKILIYGASGSVGTAAVQIARAWGAEVTAVCSAKNRELMLTLGAEFVFDYSKEQFTEQTKCYDIIFDTVGKISVQDSLPSLSAEGCLILSGAGVSQALSGISKTLLGRRKALMGMAIVTMAQMEAIKQLWQEGHLKPVIDRRYALDELVEAHRYVEQGHKVGNVIVYNEFTSV
jgi:NADPH:quinone reductase-like Zn-dependent oxidoreductase